MSRIGKKPVAIPAGVTAKIDGQSIAVKGAKGELNFTVPDEVAIKIEGNVVHVEPQGEDKRSRAWRLVGRLRVVGVVLPAHLFVPRAHPRLWPVRSLRGLWWNVPRGLVLRTSSSAGDERTQPRGD